MIYTEYNVEEELLQHFFKESVSEIKQEAIIDAKIKFQSILNKAINEVNYDFEVELIARVILKPKN